MAILLPLTSPWIRPSAIVMLSRIYWGAPFGGAITSISVQHPRRSLSVATTFDGYPMAQQGRAAEALTAAFTPSFIGSLVAVLLITFLAPMISSFALKFGPARILRGISSDLLSFVSSSGREPAQDRHFDVARPLARRHWHGHGIRPIAHDAWLRRTVARHQFLVAVIGLFGISEILPDHGRAIGPARPRRRHQPARVVLSVWKDLPKYWVTLLRSSFIGCWLGITPGGAIAASFMGYNLAKAFFHDPTASARGASKACSRRKPVAHASGTSALLPMLALAFPAPAPRRSCSEG